MTVVAHNVAVEEMNESFARVFGGTPEIFLAPGRVNLIGDHTDYNEGFVMPMAINRGVVTGIKCRRDRTLRVRSRIFTQTVEINLDALPAEHTKSWSDFVVGVALELTRIGYQIKGADILIDSDVPLGSGLSSSAALEVSVASALVQASGQAIDPLELALLCQRAENNFVGAKCGIMDQFISANGEEGRALMLDCRSLHFEASPIPSGVVLVVCNSMVTHSIAAGAYNTRRRECEAAVTVLQQKLPQIKSLRDVTKENLDEFGALLPQNLLKRARHVVTENARVLSAAAALKTQDLRKFGALMNESHRSLRLDYEVSIPELDVLAATAQTSKGVFGARMTGGGFGGCIVALVAREHATKLCKNLEDVFLHEFSVRPEIYECYASQGVHRLA